jgi:response regulator NasT
MLMLQNQNEKLQKKIEEMRMVDRAKCALIQYLRMTEQQAHRHIEKQAMDTRQTKMQVARDIVNTYEML